MKNELRYYLRVAVTLGLTLLAARYGVKIEPPPLEVRGPVVLKLEASPLTTQGEPCPQP